MKSFHVTQDTKGILFVDHSINDRSGHLGHALVEYAPGCILAFYPNNSGARSLGHNGFGWMEYKRSLDGGKTWGEPEVLDYSVKAFQDGVFTICCEKAVLNQNGEIVLFCLKASAYAECWGPFFEPVALISKDEGKSWSAPIAIGERNGRVYDVFVKNDEIFCLVEVGVYTQDIEYPGYHMFKSTDGGRSFVWISELPFAVSVYKYSNEKKCSLARHFYGCIDLLPDDTMIVYAYNEKDEFSLEYTISNNNGVSWSEVRKTAFKKRIRNPQICSLNGIYFMHGRSGSESTEYPSNFVLYTSEDGINWDEGSFIGIPHGEDAEGWFAYYSNNLVVHPPHEQPKILIQASDSYWKGKTNIKHWWITF